MSARRAIGLTTAAVLCVFTLGVASPRAAAGQFVIHPCDSAAQNVSWELPQFAWFNRSVDCPLIRAWAGLLEGPVSFPVAARYPAIFARDGSVEIDGATMNMQGLSRPDLGRYQGVRFCTKTNCGPILPTGVGVDGVQSFSQAAGEIPNGAQWMEVVGDCDAGADCPETPELRVSDISLTYADSIPPQLYWHEPHIVSNDLGTDRWVNSRRPISFSITENGSGVAHSRFEFSPSGYVQFSYVRCSLFDQSFDLRVCPNSGGGPEWTPDPVTQPQLLPEGPNSVKFWAVDLGRGKSAVQEIKFNVDITPPLAPQNMRVVGSPTGWTNQTSADIAWDPIADPGGLIKWTTAKVGTTTPATLGGNPGILPGVSLTPNATTKVEVFAVDKAGNTGLSSSFVVGHDDHVLAPPPLAAPHYIGRDALQNAAVSWTPPADLAEAPSGLCGYSLDVNDDPVGAPPTIANITGSATQAKAPGDRFEGDHFMHLRAISCSGQAGAVAHAPVTYDLTPPRADHDRPQGNWLNEGDPLVIHATDAQTAVQAIHYSIDGAAEVTVPGDSTSLALGDGLHEVRYQAEDLAGNRSDSRSIVLGVDGSPPSAWIEPTDPERPTLMRAFATDKRAGLAWARFVYRPAGATGDWLPFGEEQRPSPAAPEALSLTARFPDLELPDGDYELGVMVRDRVGREAVSTFGVYGPAAVVHLPLRPPPQLSFRALDGAIGRKAVFLRFGEGATVVGRLVGSDGEPLRQVTVELSRRRALTTQRVHLRSLVTDDDGRFRTRVGPGVAREIIARFAGAERIKPVERSVALQTRARVGLIVSPRRVRSGHRLRFDMRVSLADATISNVGRLADLQFLSSSGKWKNYTIDGPYPLQRDLRRKGWARFVKRDPAPPFPEPRVLRFRLYVPTQERWPYVTGWSRTVAVTVLPPRRR